MSVREWYKDGDEQCNVCGGPQSTLGADRVECLRCGAVEVSSDVR